MRILLSILLLLFAVPAMAQEPAELPDYTKIKGAIVMDEKDAVALGQALDNVKRKQSELEKAQAEAFALQQAYRALYFEILAKSGIKPDEYELKDNGKNVLVFIPVEKEKSTRARKAEK